MLEKIRHNYLWIILIGLFFFMPACERSVYIELASPENPGVTDIEIRIGSSLALGGHAGYLGTQTLHGAMSYINHINDQGGIHGRTIKLVVYDDGYDPPRCITNTQKLIINDKVFCLFCYVGTPTTVKIIPIVQEAKIPLVGMFTGAYELREPVQRYLISVRASYYQEIDAAVQHLIRDLNIEKIAVLYQYDAYGFDGLKGAELSLKRFGLLPVAKGTYIRGTLNIEEGLDKIMESEAEAVVMIGTYDPCAKFIRLSRQKGFDPVFYNVSFVGADELSRILGTEGEGVIISQVVPPPDLPEIRKALEGKGDYIHLLKTYYPEDKPNFVSLEGYINARVLVEGLKRAGKDLNREKFVDAIESIHDFDLGIDNHLSFSPNDHQGLEKVYFTQIRNGKFMLINEWRREKEEGEKKPF